MRSIGVIALLVCLSGCTSVKSAPPRLAIVKIQSKRFVLKYDGKTDLSIGTNLHGYVVTKLSPKFKMQTSPGGTHFKDDMSELTLKRGDKTIILVKGRPRLHVEFVVHLSDLTDQRQYSVRTGKAINIGPRTLRLREVNVKKQNCELEDVKSGELFTIKRMAQPQIAP